MNSVQHRVYRLLGAAILPNGTIDIPLSWRSCGGIPPARVAFAHGMAELVARMVNGSTDPLPAVHSQFLAIAHIRLGVDIEAVALRIVADLGSEVEPRGIEHYVAA